MIIIPEVCDKCGGFEAPTDVACDKCERIQKIEDFIGVVLHFSKAMSDGDPCDMDCENCEENNLHSPCEFHFCDMKCLSEYLADPNNDCFSKFEDSTLTLYVDSVNIGPLFYALGRCDLQ